MEKEDLKNIVQEEKRLHKESYASILQLQMDLQKQMEKQKEEETRQEKVKLIELEEELLNIKIKLVNLHLKINVISYNLFI